MQNTKLKNCLAAMRSEEWAAFGKYMASPYFAHRAETVALWAYVAQYRARTKMPDMAALDLSNTALQTILAAHGGAKAATRVSWVATAFVQCIEDFWVQERLAQQAQNRAELLLDEYETRGLYKAMSATIEAMQTANEAQPQRSLAYLETTVLVEKKKIHIEQLTSRQRFELTALDGAIDALFVAYKLELYANQLSRATIFEQTLPDDALIQALLQQVKNTPALLGQPFVQLHYLSIVCLQDDDIAQFVAFVNLLIAQQAAFNYDELRRAYQFAENICALRIRRGNAAYWQQLFDLYKQGAANNTLHNVNGVLPSGLYKNVVTVALRFEAFDWILDFVKQQAAYLPQGEKEDVFSFNLAKIFFAQQRYPETLELVGRLSYTDLTHKLGARLLLLKTYYKLQKQDPNYGDVLESELAAFKMFVHRLQGFSKENKTVYRNFISCFRKMLYLPPNSRSKAAQLHQRITDLDLIAEKAWLLAELK
jgi:hypothetical protein